MECGEGNDEADRAEDAAKYLSAGFVGFDEAPFPFHDHINQKRNEGDEVAIESDFDDAVRFGEIFCACLHDAEHEIGGQREHHAAHDVVLMRFGGYGRRGGLFEGFVNGFGACGHFCIDALHIDK